MRGINDDEIVDFAEFGRDKGLTVRFIEFMPLEAGDVWNEDRFPLMKSWKRSIKRFLSSPLSAAVNRQKGGVTWTVRAKLELSLLSPSRFVEIRPSA